LDSKASLSTNSGCQETGISTVNGFSVGFGCSHKMAGLKGWGLITA